MWVRTDSTSYQEKSCCLWKRRHMKTHPRLLHSQVCHYRLAPGGWTSVTWSRRSIYFEQVGRLSHGIKSDRVMQRERERKNKTLYLKIWKGKVLMNDTIWLMVNCCSNEKQTHLNIQPLPGFPKWSQHRGWWWGPSSSIRTSSLVNLWLAWAFCTCHVWLHLQEEERTESNGEVPHSF